MDAYRDDEQATIHMQAARIAGYERGELPLVARLRKIAVLVAAVCAILAYMAGTVVGREQAVSALAVEQPAPLPDPPTYAWTPTTGWGCWHDADRVCLHLGEATVCLVGPLDTAAPRW